MRPPPLLFAAALLSSALSSSCASPSHDGYLRHLAELRELSTQHDVSRAPSASLDDAPFAGAVALTREDLVAAVLASNPNIDAARQAWRAAVAEVPQRTALADPMASYALAPLSIGGDATFGQEAMLAQSLPFPGKLELRGAAALSEADAMRDAFEATRLELALMASLDHAEYFENARALEINHEHQALLLAIRATLQARFEAGEETLQGPLGAELELTDVERDRVRLVAAGDVIAARINQLLHRPPGAALPPAPATLPAVEPTDATSAALFEEAIAQRPELGALRARIRAAEADIAMAKAEYWPDFSLNAAYSSMQMEPSHQLTIGGTIDIPLQVGRRAAAADQAEARRRAVNAELLAQLDAVRTEVESERRRVAEARAVVASFDERTLPLARAVTEAAQAGVQTGRTSFLELLEAERALRGAQLQHAAALAALHAQIARLERALGRTPSSSPAAPNHSTPGAQP